MKSKLFFVLIFIAAACHAVAQDDYDCYDKFFKRSTKPASAAKIILVQKDGKSVTLQAFLKDYEMEGSMSQPNYGLIDLDKDGKQELVINTFTGGAHCCDEFYFYTNTAVNKYSFAAKTFAGDVCVNDKNEFSFNFYQQFGYFFTCFACAYEDTTTNAPKQVSGISLQYNKSKLEVVPPAADLKTTITNNLTKLSKQPYKKLATEDEFDNGLRKEFAMNMAVYYYSFGKNVTETQALFTKYYKYPDAQKVWKAFAEQLQALKENNSF